MKTILFIFLATVCLTVHAGDNSWLYGHRSQDNPAYQQWKRSGTTTIVHATSPYTNPYFRPNSNYEPVKIGEPTWVYNEFKGELAEPPRGLLEILVKGTYTIKKEKRVSPVK